MFVFSQSWPRRFRVANDYATHFQSIVVVLTSRQTVVFVIDSDCFANLFITVTVIIIIVIFVVKIAAE